MSGMKQGAGEDPFADESETDDSTSSTESDSDPTATTPEQAETEPSEPSTSSEAQSYPYMLVRDTVKEDRDNEHIYFLRDEYAEREDEIRAEVADLLGKRTKDVYITDIREAILATADSEDVAEMLREWGIDAK